MINFNNRKTKRIFSAIIAGVLVIAMAIGMLAAF